MSINDWIDTMPLLRLLKDQHPKMLIRTDLKDQGLGDDVIEEACHRGEIIFDGDGGRLASVLLTVGGVEALAEHNPEAGLPLPMRDLLFQQIPDGKDWRYAWNRFLSFNNAPRTEDHTLLAGFLQALDQDRIDVHVDICEDEPHEIVVRARGYDAQETYWDDLNLILLGGSWDDQDGVSQGLADAIVDRWDDLRALNKTLKTEAEPTNIPGLS